MNHCKDCKWWRALDEKFVGKSGWGTCDRFVTHEGGPLYPGIKAAATARGHAYFFTAPDFGYVQWEPRE